MAKSKKSKARRIYVRAKHHANKLTMASIMKKGIAITPVAAHVHEGWKTGGIRNALDNFQSSYSGIRSSDMAGSKQGAYLSDLLIGYGGMGAAWLFGKVNSRVRVF